MIKQTDLYMTAAFTLAIADLRKNKFLWRDIISDVAEDPILNKLYGEKEIAKFYEFMAKDIQVNVEHMIDMAKLPAIGIRVGGGQEDTSRTGDALGDGYEQEQVDASSLDGAIVQNPMITIASVTPLSYDKTTGELTFDNTVDLSKVYEDMYCQTQDGQNYKISVVLTHSFFVDPNLTVDFTNMKVLPLGQKMSNIRRESFFWETVTIVPTAAEPVEALYLYSIIMYCIGRYRLDLLESKNFVCTTTQYGALYKASEVPMAFARDITLKGRVNHNWIASTQGTVQGIGPRIMIEDMQSPTSEEDQVSGQGWQGEGDNF